MASTTYTLEEAEQIWAAWDAMLLNALLKGVIVAVIVVALIVMLSFFELRSKR